MAKWLTCPRCGAKAGGQTWDQASALMKRHMRLAHVEPVPAPDAATLDGGRA